MIYLANLRNIGFSWGKLIMSFDDDWLAWMVIGLTFIGGAAALWLPTAAAYGWF